MLATRRQRVTQLEESVVTQTIPQPRQFPEWSSAQCLRCTGRVKPFRNLERLNRQTRGVVGCVKSDVCAGRFAEQFEVSADYIVGMGERQRLQINRDFGARDIQTQPSTGGRRGPTLRREHVRRGQAAVVQTLCDYHPDRAPAHGSA